MNAVRKSGAVALAVLAFVTGACLIALPFLGHLLDIPGDIVLAVCVGLALNYLFVRNIIVHNPDFLRVVARYFLILLAVAAWDVPAYASALSACVFLLALLVFTRRQLLAEMRKLFSA